MPNSKTLKIETKVNITEVGGEEDSSKDVLPEEGIVLAAPESKVGSAIQQREEACNILVDSEGFHCHQLEIHWSQSHLHKPYWDGKGLIFCYAMEYHEVVKGKDISKGADNPREVKYQKYLRDTIRHEFVVKEEVAKDILERFQAQPKQRGGHVMMEICDRPHLVDAYIPEEDAKYVK